MVLFIFISLVINRVRNNKDTFTKLLIFSVALFACGLGPFYAISRTSFGEFVSTTQSGRDTVGAVVAVVLTNVVIGCYVISAFNEPPETTNRSSVVDKKD